MNKYRLLIADSDVEYVNRAAAFLSKMPELKIAGIAHDGVQALRLLTTVKPDVILMDPLLPELDGLSLMKKAQTLKHRPVIICLSQFYSSISIELARRNGAGYYAYKPIELKALAAIIVECAEMDAEMRRSDRDQEEISRWSEIKSRIHAIIRDMGFSAKLSGSEYLAESVAIAVESPMMLHNLSTGLYKQLADRLQTSVSCIERSMRTAISAANVDGALEAIIGAAPTNKTCIRYVLRALNLEM